MVVSKPKTRAIFAIGVFILLCLSIGGYNLRYVMAGTANGFNIAMSIIFLPTGLIFLLRQLFNYKVISIGNAKIQVWYPLRFKTIRGELKDMLYWEETEIKTKNDVFRQLEVKFPSRSIKMSIQENSNYIQAANYLKKKHIKKLKK